MALAACAQPERQLLEEFADSEIVLAPGTTVAPVDDEGAAETTGGDSSSDLVDTSDRFGPGSPQVPAADLPGLSFVATATTAMVDLSNAANSSDPIFSYANPLPSGAALTLLVEQFAGAERLEVLVPGIPTGAFGWVDASDVALSHHNFSLLVELSNQRVTVFERELSIMQADAAINPGSAPLASGRYFTTELVNFADTTAFGPYGFGLSGSSASLEPFAGEPGQLAIHGTDEPETIGTPVTSGSIRLRNEDMDTLVQQIGLPAGVPVVVI